MRKEWNIGCTIIVCTFLYCNLHILIDYIPNRYHLPAWMFGLLFAGNAVVDLLDGTSFKSIFS